MHVNWSRRTDACYLEQKSRCMLFGTGRHTNVTLSLRTDACYLEYENGCRLPGAGRRLHVTMSVNTSYLEQGLGA